MPWILLPWISLHQLRPLLWGHSWRFLQINLMQWLWLSGFNKLSPISGYCLHINFLDLWYDGGKERIRLFRLFGMTQSFFLLDFINKIGSYIVFHIGLEIPLIYRLKRPLRELGFPVLNQLKVSRRLILIDQRSIKWFVKLFQKVSFLELVLDLRLGLELNITT